VDFSSQIRSGHIIIDNQLVSLSWPQAPDCDTRPYFSFEENFSIVFCGMSTQTGGQGCHVQGSQSLSVLCVYSHSCVEVDIYIYESKFILLEKMGHIKKLIP